MSTRPTSTSIERARAEDVGDVCVALVEAFRDNPVAAWVIADADQRATVLRGRFELLGETFLGKKARYGRARDEVRAHPSQTPRFRIGGGQWRKGVWRPAALIKTIRGMAQNFIGCDREQVFLMPPSLREWLPEDHFAWFVIDAVDGMDLSPFVAAYRRDGHGRPAHDPAMMLGLLMYGYARGLRSSRRIKRACIEDIAFRVIAANQVPDHTTIARFRQRHEVALAGVFSQVLALCADAGLMGTDVIAVDGTKVMANASREANVDYDRLAQQILEEAAEVDAREDEQYGDARGDELPPHLSRRQGRREWLREPKMRLDDKHDREARPIPRERGARLKEAKRRPDEELEFECRANAEYEAYRARGVDKNGRAFGRPPNPYRPPDKPTGTINVTDPDSRMIKATLGFIQGYNAQAAADENQIVIAAEVTPVAADFGRLQPMVEAALGELSQVGITDTPQVVLADAGYWYQVQMENIVSRGIQVLIPPDGGKRNRARPGWDGELYGFMRRVLKTETGGGLYRKRKTMIETVFADTKFNPPHRSLLTKRQGRLPVGMAANHRGPQPDQAPWPPDGAQGGLNRPVRDDLPIDPARRATRRLAARDPNRAHYATAPWELSSDGTASPSRRSGKPRGAAS